MELGDIKGFRTRLHAEVGRVVVGQDDVLDLMLTALLAEGHVLLEGVPGTAKTLLAQSFAACLSLPFKRIQFTPDLMPADVLGTNLFDFQRNTFVLTRGPVFTSVLLADEINRTPPKTQSALLEAMQERAVTIDGTGYPLPGVFMVIATQNPIEQEGTYPLPEAQLDRFIFKIDVGYPALEAERAMVRLHGARSAMPRLSDFQLAPLADGDSLAAARARVAEVLLSDAIVDYVVALVRATRESADLACGASPRAGTMLAAASRAHAALEGREYVVPEDVKRLVVPTLRHRLLVSAEADMEQLAAEVVLSRILEQVPAPR